MADKKPDTKVAPAGKSADWFEYFFLFLLFVLGGGFFLNWLNTKKYIATGATLLSSVEYNLINLFARFAVFSFFFSAVMIVIVVIYARRMHAMRKKIMDTVEAEDKTAMENLSVAAVANPKWQLVQSHINSDDPNKWKLAILEADIMLADLLESMHLPGDTIGDKLKAVDTADFKSIEAAWEGHKIRNAIAHQGSDFLLNEREAKRVIALYQNVFDEFEII